MALFNWTRREGAERPEAAGDRSHGFDLTASRLLAVRAKGEGMQSLPLDGTHASLPLAIGFGARHLAYGRSALQQCRRHPHFVCNGYLALLGQDVQWRSDWHAFTPETALQQWAERLRSVLPPKAGGLWAFPSYLSEAGTRAVQNALVKARLEVNPTYMPELALVADRASTLWQDESLDANGKAGSWHPKRAAANGEALVMIVQADHHALSASLVRVDQQEAKLAASTHFTKFGERVWFDRLLDGLSDRCVRICRRDPRDSADSEQMLFDQLEPMLDGVRFGRKVNVGIRASTWYQDLLLGEEDLALLAKPVLKPCVESLIDWLQRTIPQEMPGEVWLRAEAGRLPGLAMGLHQNLAEQTRVRILPVDAVATALARLSTGTTPRAKQNHREAIGFVGVAS